MSARPWNDLLADKIEAGADLQAPASDRRHTGPARQPPYLALPNALTADACMALDALAHRVAVDDADYAVTKTGIAEAQTFLSIAGQANRRLRLDEAEAALLRAAAIVIGTLVAVQQRIARDDRATRDSVAGAAERMASRVFPGVAS